MTAPATGGQQTVNLRSLLEEMIERDASDLHITAGDKPKLRIIRLGTREDFEGVFTRLAGSKSPFSPQDQDDVKWFVAQYRDGIKRLLPDQIPCKENFGFLGAELIRGTSDVEALAELLAYGLSTLSWSALYLIGITAFMFMLDVKLALVAMCSLPFIIGLTWWFSPTVPRPL